MAALALVLAAGRSASGVERADPVRPQPTSSHERSAASRPRPVPPARALRRTLDAWARGGERVEVDGPAWRAVLRPALAASRITKGLAGRLRSLLRSRRSRVSAEADAGIRAALRRSGLAKLASGSWPKVTRRRGQAFLAVTVLPEQAGPPLEEFTAHRVPIRRGRQAATPHVVVDELMGFQELDGLGAGLTDASAEVLLRLPRHTREAVLRKLFDPVEGVGLSYLRVPIGPTDFSSELRWHADPPVGADRLQGFSLARDRPIIRILELARRINPQLKLMASPWSPPPGMLARRGDKAILAPEHRVAYARYLVRFLEEYAALSPPIYFDTLTVQNEPLYYNAGYPTLEMLPEEASALIAEVAPRLTAARLPTRIIGFDHNWDLWRYADRLLRSRVGKHVAGTAFHGYGGEVKQQDEIARRHPEKEIHFTEISAISTPGSNPADDLQWDLANVVIGAMRHHARSVLKWNLALDERHGPKNGGCQNCRGLVTVRDDGTVDFNEDFYALGMASKFVRPGARRVQTVAVAPDLEAVAFKNPDGTKALVMANRSSSPRRVDVAAGGGRTMVAEIPARGAATLVWE